MKSSSASVRNTSGQNSGVPGRLFLHPVARRGLALRTPTAAPDRPRAHSGRPPHRADRARSGQPFIEKPDAPRVAAGRAGPHQRLDRRGAGCQKQPLEDGQIEPFIFEGEGQMAFERRRRGMARRHDAPAVSSMMRWRSPMAHRVRGSGTARP